MRPQTDSRIRRACATIAALGLSYTATAAATQSVHVKHVVGVPTTVAPVLPSGGTASASASQLAAPMPSGISTVTNTHGTLTLITPIRTRLSVRNPELNVLDDHPARIRGLLSPGLARQLVLLQVRGNHGWRTVAHTLTDARGHFQLRYVPGHTMSEPVRLDYAGRGPVDGSHRLLGRLNAYRLAGASWYAGGGSLACGGSLTSSTMGVANKTLPCGTMVALRYHGRSVRVPVVDRGPYVAGREYDLTQATKQALGFGDTGEVWSTR
jgi:rare lipoprotein A